MNFPHALVLIRVNYQTDSEGLADDDAGAVLEADPTLTEFKGWIQPRQPVPVDGESGAAVTTDRLYAPVSLPIRKGDRVRWQTGIPIYEVIEDPRDAAGRGHHLEVDLVRWRDQPEAVA